MTRTGSTGAHPRRGRDRVPGRDPQPRHRVRDRHRGVERPARLLDVVPVAAQTPCLLGFPAASRPGATRSRWRRWTRSSATPPRCAPPCRGRCGCWTRSTSSSSASTPSTRSAAGCSRRPSGTAAAATTRCTGSGGCCAAARPSHPAVLGSAARRPGRRRRRPADRPRVDRRPRAAAALPRTRPGPRQRRLLRWFTTVAEQEIPELLRLARTLDAWREELLAYFDTGGVSNGPTEAVNGLIKKIKRIGHGYRNFANYRLRLLLELSAHTLPGVHYQSRGRPGPAAARDGVRSSWALRTWAIMACSWPMSTSIAPITAYVTRSTGRADDAPVRHACNFRKTRRTSTASAGQRAATPTAAPLARPPARRRAIHERALGSHYNSWR